MYSYQQRNGKVLINNKEIMTLEHIPMFCNNEEMKKLKQEASELEDKLWKLKEQVSENPPDEKLEQAYYKTKESISKVKDKIADFEKSMIEIESTFVEIAGKGPISQKQIYAQKCLESGNVEEAKRVLSFDEIKREADERIAKGEIRKQELQIYVNEFIQRAETLKLDINNENRFKEIEEAYTEAVLIEQKANLHRIALRKLAQFFNVQRDYQKAFYMYERLISYLKLEDEKIDIDLYHSFANCCMSIQKYYDAKQYMKKALKSYERKLEDEDYFIDKDMTLFYIATVLKDLSLLCLYTDDLDGAEEYGKRALEVAENISQRDYASKVTLILVYGRLSSVYSQKKDYENAEKCSLKVIELLENESYENEELYLKELNGQYQNLSSIYIDMNRYEKAEEYAEKNVELIHKLMKQNPEKYRDDLFFAYSNIALLYKNMKKFDLAEKYQVEAMEIIEILMRRSPHTYAQYLIVSYNNIIDLYEKAGNLKKKQEWYDKLVELSNKTKKEDAEN